MAFFDTFYPTEGEPGWLTTPGGASDIGTTDYNASGDIFQGVMSGLSAIQAAMGARDVGRDMRNEFSKQYGVDVNDLPNDPRFLRAKDQQKQEAGIALAKSIPYVGEYAAGALRGYKTVAQRTKAAQYFAKMFNSVPEFKEAGLKVPIDKAGGSEKAVQGGYAGFQEMLGPMKPVVHAIHEGTKKLDPLGYGNVMKLHAFGGGPDEFLKKKEEEHQREIERINQENKAKYEDYKGTMTQQPVAMKALQSAYGDDPRLQYILRILAMRQIAPPTMRKPDGE